MLIPLRNRAGEVIAHTEVDDEDYERLNAHAWRLDHGYAARGVRRDGKYTKILMAREVCGLTRGDGLEADHIEGDSKLNNRRSNLRVVTHAQNGQNRSPNGNKTKNGTKTSSSLRGVSWNAYRGKWQARATKNYKEFHLGYFNDEDEAGRAAAAFRAKQMPWATS